MLNNEIPHRGLGCLIFKSAVIFCVLTVPLGIVGCNLSLEKQETNSPIQEGDQSQPNLKITGSGSTYPALKLLQTAYKSQANSNIILLPASQSSSGIAGVKNGVVEIGTVSRVLKLEEDDGSIIYRELARDAIVVATHPSVEGVSNLSTEDLKKIYSGTITNWNELGGVNAEIIVLDRPEDESGKRLLREYYLGKELANAPNAVILRQESDLITALKSTPYSIGAFSFAYAISNQLPVNRLSLNGIEATPGNVENNQYQMVRHLGIVTKKNPSATTQNFLDFIFSKQGTDMLRNSGFVPSPSAQE